MPPSNRGGERFGLSWPGKAAAVRQASTACEGELRCLAGRGVNEAATGNLIVEGENLTTLKLLAPAYRGRIRMIYIDPPYNTGKDFIYRDDYTQTAGAYRQSAEADPGDGSRGGRFHARWLSMMYPRLILARDFLTDDGAILVSIDDNELFTLRAIMGEIFGEENFVGTFVWLTKREAKGMPTRTMFAKNHEYVLCFARNATAFAFRGEPRTLEGFSNPDDDPRGPWKRQYLQRFGQGFPVRRLVNPANGMVFSFETPYTEEKMATWAAEGRLMFPKARNRYPARKEYFNEYRNGNKPILSFLDLFSTKVNTERIKPLLGIEKVFQFTKPVELVRKLIAATTGPDDIILDFFAGSGTTAQAVLELNREDGGNRSFILVQLPEPVDPASEAAKAGFTTIADICEERVGRVIERLGDVPPIAGAETVRVSRPGFRVAQVERPKRRKAGGGTP